MSKIYTTYFGNLGHLPPEIVPIAICKKVPIGWRKKTYKRLAPPSDLLLDWQARHDEAAYREEYRRRVLDRIDPELCRIYLTETLGEGHDVALVCYERPEKFCHRHLVAEWFREHGIACNEYTNL